MIHLQGLKLEQQPPNGRSTLPPEGGRGSLTFRMLSVFDVTREAILKIQKQLLVDGNITTAEISNQLNQFVRVLRDDQVTTTTYFAQDMQQRAQYAEELRKRLSEIGLDKYQVAYVCQQTHVFPGPIARGSGMSNPQGTDIQEAHYNLQQQVEELTRTVNRLSQENTNLRDNLARYAENQAKQSSRLVKQLDIEEKQEQEKLGVMSHEYEQKIQRLLQEEQSHDHQATAQLRQLFEMNQQLQQQVMRSTSEIDRLNFVLGQKDDTIQQMSNTIAILQSSLTQKSSADQASIFGVATIVELQTKSNQIQSMQQEINRLMQSFEQKDQEVKRYASELEQVHRNYGSQQSSVQPDLKQREAYIESLKRTVVEKNNEIHRLTAELSQLKIHLSDLKQTERPDEHLQAEFGNLQSALQKKEQEVQRLNGELAYVRQCLQQLQLDKQTQESRWADETHATVLKLEAIIHNDKRDLHTLNEVVRDKSQLIQRMEQDLHRLGSIIANQKVETEQRQTEIGKLHRMVEKINIKYKQALDDNNKLMASSSAQPAVKNISQNSLEAFELVLLKKKVTELEAANKALKVTLSRPPSGSADIQGSLMSESSKTSVKRSSANKLPMGSPEKLGSLMVELDKVAEIQGREAFDEDAQEELEESLQRIADSCYELVESKKVAGEVGKGLEKLAEISRGIASALNHGRNTTPRGLSRFKEIEELVLLASSIQKPEEFVQTAGNEAETWERITDLENDNLKLKEKVVNLNEQVIAKNTQEAQRFASDYTALSDQMRQLQAEKVMLQQNLQSVVSQANTQLQMLNIQLEQSERERESLNFLAGNYQQQLEAMQEELANSKASHMVESSKAQSLTSQQKEAAEKLVKFEASQKEWESGLLASERTVWELRQRIKNMDFEVNQKLEAQTQLAQSSQDEVAALYAKISELTLKLEQGTRDYADLEKVYTEAHAQIVKQEAISSQLEEKLRQAQVKTTEDRKSISSVEQQLKGVQQELVDSQKRFEVQKSQLQRSQVNEQQQTLQITTMGSRISQLEHESTKFHSKSQQSTAAFLKNIAELTNRIAELENREATPLLHAITPEQTSKQVDMLAYSVKKASDLQKEPQTPHNQQELSNSLILANQISTSLIKSRVLPTEVVKDLQRIAFLTQKAAQAGPKQAQDSARQINELSQSVLSLKKEITEKDREEETIAELIKRIRKLETENAELSTLVSHLTTTHTIAPTAPILLFQSQTFSAEGQKPKSVVSNEDDRINKLTEQLKVTSDELSSKIDSVDKLNEEVDRLKREKLFEAGASKQAIVESNKYQQEIKALQSKISGLEIEVKASRIHDKSTTEDKDAQLKIESIVEQVSKVSGIMKEPATPAIQREIRTKLRSISDLCQDVSSGNKLGDLVNEKLNLIKDILTHGPTQLPEEKVLDTSVSAASVSGVDRRIDDVKTLVSQIQGITERKKSPSPNRPPAHSRSEVIERDVNEALERSHALERKVDDYRQVIRETEEEVRVRNEEIFDLKETIKMLQMKIRQLEESVFYSGHHHSAGSYPQNYPQAGAQQIMQANEAQYYMSEINRLMTIIHQYEDTVRQHKDSTAHYIDQIGSLNRKVYALEEAQIASDAQNVQLREQLGFASRRMSELEYRASSMETIPKAALKAESQIYVNQISVLTKKLTDTEAKLKQQTRQLLEHEREEEEHEKIVSHFAKKIKELEREERHNENVIFEKRTELDLFRRLYGESKVKLEELAKQNTAMEIENESEHRIVAQASEETRKHLVHIASLSKKVKDLENVPRGVPQQEVQKHIMMIRELSKRLQAAENKLREQTVSLNSLHKEEKYHVSEIMTLTRRIHELQEEEDGTLEQVKAKEEKIANFKNMLNDTTRRLAELMDTNESLESENKRDMNFINKSIGDTNKHLVQIGILAQMVKEMRDLPRGHPQEEVNQYISNITELTAKLSHSENMLKEKNRQLNDVEQTDRKHQRELIEVSRQIRKLEDLEHETEAERDAKDEEVKELKFKMDNTLRKLRVQVAENKNLNKELIEEENQISAITQATNEKISSELGLKQLRINELEAQLKKDVETIGELTRKLAEAELLLKKGETQTEVIVKEERELQNQVQVLSKRIKELEEVERKSENMAYEQRTELDQFRKLYEESALKYQEMLTANSSIKSEMQNELKKASESKQQASSEVAELRKKLKEIENIPKGVPQEEVQKHLNKISELSNQLNQAESRTQDQTKILENLQKEEKEHMSLLMMVTEKIKVIEKEVQTPGREITNQQKDMDRYKQILDRTAEKIRKLSQQNKDMEEARRQERVSMETAMAEANTHLQQIGMLTNKAEKPKSQSKGVPHDETSQFTKAIKELADRLTQSESERREKEAKLNESEVNDRQYQQQILELTQKIRTIEIEDEKVHGLVGQRSQELEESKKQLENAMKNLSKQQDQLQTVMEQKRATEKQARQSQEESEKYAKQLKDLQKTLQELNNAPKGVPQEEVDVMVNRMSKLTAEVSELETKNNTLSDQLTKTQAEYEKLKSILDELKSKYERMEKGEKRYENLALSTGEELAQYKQLLAQANSSLQSQVAANKQLEVANNESEQAVTSTQNETKSLKDKIKTLQARVKELESIPKGVSEAEIHKYTNKIGEMSYMITQLEVKLQSRDSEVGKIALEEKQQAEKVRALASRIDQLQKEDRQVKDDLLSKESELEQLRRLHKETQAKLEETIIMNRHLQEENERDSEQIMKLSNLSGSHMSEIAELRRKAKEIQEVPHDIPEGIVRDKVSQISELSMKLSQSEVSIRSQAERLAAIQNEEKQHRNLIVILNDKINKLEAQEKMGGESKAHEIAILRRSLEDATSRLAFLDKQNRDLEAEHEHEIDQVTQGLAQANTCLLEIASASAKTRQSYGPGHSRFMRAVHDLASRLTRSEGVDIQKIVEHSHLGPREQQQRVVQLTQRVKQLESQKTQSELLTTMKQELQEAIQAMKSTQESGVQAQSSLVDERKQLERFEVEARKFGEKLNLFNRRVVGIDAFPKHFSLTEVQQLAELTTKLRLKLEETENILKAREQSLAGGKDEDREHARHMQIILRKLQELESAEGYVSESAVVARHKEIEFYRSLLNDTTRKMQASSVIPIPLFDSQLDEANPNDKVARVSAIVQQAKVLDKSPPGVSHADVDKNLSLMYSIESQMLASEQRVKEQKERMARLLEDQSRYASEIVFLSDRLESTERQEVKGLDQTSAKDSKVERLQNMLEEASRRLQASLEENAAIRDQQRKDLEELRSGASEGLKRLKEVATSIRQKMKGQDSQQEEYLQTISELSEQLQESEGLLKKESERIEQMEETQKELTREARNYGRSGSQTLTLRKSLSEKLKKAYAQSTIVQVGESSSNTNLGELDKLMTKERDLKSKNSALHNRVKELESQVYSYSVRLGESHFSEADLRSKVNSLSERVKSLEREEDQSQILSEEKKAELNMYRKFLSESRRMLEQQTETQRDIQARLVYEAERIANSQQANSQQAQISFAARKLKELATRTTSNEGKEELERAEQLIEKAVTAEEELRQHALAASNSKKEEELLVQQLLLLHDRVNETKKMDLEQEERKTRLAEYNGLIDSSAKRFESITNEHRQLDVDLSRRQQALYESVRLTSEQLLRIARPGKDDEDKQKAPHNMSAQILEELASRLLKTISKDETSNTSVGHQDREQRRELVHLSQTLRHQEGQESQASPEDTEDTRHRLFAAMRQLRASGNTAQSASKQTDLAVTLKQRVSELERQQAEHEEEEVVSKREYIELVDELNEKLIKLEAQNQGADSSHQADAIRSTHELTTLVKRLTDLHVEISKPEVVKERAVMVERIANQCKKIMDTRKDDFEVERLLQGVNLLANRVRDDGHRQSGRRLAELVTSVIKLQLLVRRGMSPDIRKRKRELVRNQARDEEQRSQEVQTLKHKITEIKHELQNKEDEIRKYREIIDSLNVRAKEAETNLSQAQGNQAKVYMSQINLLASQLSEMESAMHVHPQYRHDHSQIQQHNMFVAVEQTNKLTHKLYQSDQTCAELRQTVTQYAEKIDKLEQRLNEANAAIKNRTLLEEKLDRLDQENTRLAEDRHNTEVEADTKIAEAEKAVSSLQAQLDKSKNINSALQRDLDSLRRQVTMFLHSQAGSLKASGVEAMEGSFVKGELGKSWISEMAVLKNDLPSPSAKELFESYVAPPGETLELSVHRQDQQKAQEQQQRSFDMVQRFESPHTTQQHELVRQAEVLLAGRHPHQPINIPQQPHYHSDIQQSNRGLADQQSFQMTQSHDSPHTMQNELRRQAEALLGPRHHHQPLDLTANVIPARLENSDAHSFIQDSSNFQLRMQQTNQQDSPQARNNDRR